jgi:hypothetical protein
MSLRQISPDSSPYPLWPYLVVQDLVLLFQTRHESVLGKVIWTGAILGVCALDLLVKSLDVCR